MKKQLQQLIEWHEAFDVPYMDEPVQFNDCDHAIRANLMNEEVEEWYKAADAGEPITNRAKELADILYTVFGTIIHEGLQDQIEQVFDAVHQSNMSKLGADGKPVKRADGKVLKGPNYMEPDLSFLLKPLSEPDQY